MKNDIHGHDMGLQLMDEGPFSDFGVEAQIIGFSLGTLVLVVLTGFLSLLLGRFVSCLLYTSPSPRDEL